MVFTNYIEVKKHPIKSSVCNKKNGDLKSKFRENIKGTMKKVKRIMFFMSESLTKLHKHIIKILNTIKTQSQREKKLVPKSKRTKHIVTIKSNQQSVTFEVEQPKTLNIRIFIET